MMGVVVEGRKSLRQPWNKRTHFLYSGAGCAMLDVSDAPEGSIYFGCPLTQHLQLFNLLCAKERSSQRACVWEKVIVLGVCGVVINFMTPLHPQALLVPTQVPTKVEWALEASQRTQLLPSAVVRLHVWCGGW